MIATTYRDFRFLFSVAGTDGTDGYPVWDLGVPEVVQPWTSPFVNFPVDIDLAGADDAGPDEWHWYLSLPNLGSSDAYLTIARRDIAPTTRSGRVRLSLGPSHVGVMNATKANLFFRNAYLYARKLSDDTVYMADLHRCAFSPASFDV